MQKLIVKNTFKIKDEEEKTKVISEKLALIIYLIECKTCK